jgi:hypothetical protein|tara:strand:+ start:187 stop:633 length:447 start_codon:yes stop_codon:yes gene_type:complete
MSVTVEMDFDLKRINFNFSKELNKVGEIIKRDHYQRLERGEGVDGSQMKSLSPNTISAKGNNKILVDTGQMRNLVIDKASKTNQAVVIHPGEKRQYKGTSVTMSDVGGFHQKGNTNLPKREWFGISNDANQRSERLMEERIEQELRRA